MALFKPVYLLGQLLVMSIYRVVYKLIVLSITLHLQVSSLSPGYDGLSPCSMYVDCACLAKWDLFYLASLVSFHSLKTCLQDTHLQGCMWPVMNWHPLQHVPLSCMSGSFPVLSVMSLFGQLVSLAILLCVLLVGSLGLVTFIGPSVFPGSSGCHTAKWSK